VRKYDAEQRHATRNSIKIKYTFFLVTLDNRQKDLNEVGDSGIPVKFFRKESLELNDNTWTETLRRKDIKTIICSIKSLIFCGFLINFCFNLINHFVTKRKHSASGHYVIFDNL